MMRFAGTATLFAGDMTTVQSVHVIPGEIENVPVYVLFDQDGEPLLASTASSDMYFFAAEHDWRIETVH